MSDLLLRIYRNVWPITLALLVHIILFSLMSVNLDWTRTLKPAAMQPIQAVAIVEPLPEPEPQPEIVPEPPKPEPEPEPEPPKPKPKPKPVKQVYSYPCAGKQLDTDSEEKAKALQADCEEEERKKKAAEEKKKQEKLAAEKKRKQEELRKKEQEAAKKKQAEEAAKKKKAEEAAKKKQAEEAAKKKKVAEAAKKKKAAEAARKKKAADAAKKKKAAEAAKRAKQRAVAERALKAKLDKEGAERAWGAAIGGVSGDAIGRHVSNNYRYNPSCSGRSSTWLITATPTGQILNIKMSSSSGNDTCDREAGLAIKNSDPLPLNVGWPTAKPEEFRFNFRPE